MSASNQILDAVELLTENLIKKAAYDKTIQAQIISCEDQTIGKYKCRYQDAIIYAYSNSIDVTYNERAYVYILVPDNDMSKEKTILGTVNRLGINYISQVGGEQAYNTVGTNCISSSQTIYLNTKIDEYRYKIYPNQNNLITIDSQINNYIKKSSSLLIGAVFKTNIQPERQYRGHYGIQFNLSFKDNATEKTIIRPYILNQDNMIGNPYRLSTDIRQYEIFDIDGQNFQNIDSIEVFCQDFIQAQKGSSNLIGEEDADIFISSLEIMGMNRMTQEEINGVSISFFTPQGIVFNSNNNLSELKITAQVKIKGKIVSSAQNINFYWGSENASVFADSEYYNKYLGKGWKCLNEKNIIKQGTETTNPVIEWVPKKDSYVVKKQDAFAKNNKFKVAILYDNSVITKEINIQNLNEDVEEIYIQSNSGTQFYYDIGHPTLTCKIKGKQNISIIENYNFYWGYVSNTGVFENLETTIEDNRKYSDAVISLQKAQDAIKKGNSDKKQKTLQECQNAVAAFKYIQRVKYNCIYDVQISKITSFGTFKCSIYQKGQNGQNKKYLGTASITLTNKLEGEGVYSLVINNGSETFQYDQNGISPTNGSKQTPQQLKALSFTIYDNLGQPIEDKSNKYKIRWEFPVKDTLLQNKNGTEQGISSDGNYKYYNSSTLIYDIAKKYNINKQRNQIKLTVDYNNMHLVSTTSFSFVKQGEAGTNGTDYVVKIVPNTANPPLFPMITYYNNGSYKLNYIIQGDLTNDLIVERDRTKPKKLLKVQLWKNGDEIDLSTNSTIKWEVLKNNYGNKIEDTSAFVVSSDGNISYKNFLTEKEENGNDTTSPSASIIKCSVTIDKKTYYGTIPIITAKVLNSNYEIKLKDYTGFRHVMYSDNGLFPQYDSNNPFEFICRQKIDNEWWDVSLAEGDYKKTFSYKTIGSYYSSTDKKFVSSNLLSIENKGLPLNQRNLVPASKYDGVCVNNSFICVCRNNKQNIVAKINIPIHFLLNKYGLANINAWDGNSIQVNEDGGFILSPQVGAGSKDDNNNFTGILIGETKYNNKIENGLLGYSEGQRTIFLNSKNGSAIFGKNGKGQIVIDPNQSALLYSNNFWKDYDESGLPKNYNPTNRKKEGMLINLSVPSIEWGNGKFSVKEGGNLTSTSGSIGGWAIQQHTLNSSSNSITLQAGYKEDNQWKKLPAIYSGDHSSFQGYQKKTPPSGFYLSAQGLSIGSKIKIDKDGVMKIGPGAVQESGRHWTINGNKDKNTQNAYISYGGLTSFTSDRKPSSVYLGTDGIVLGKYFSVDDGGNLASTSGKIGGWTITSDSLSASGININKRGSIQTTNFKSGDKGWQILGSGSAQFNTVTIRGNVYTGNGKIGGWTVTSTKLSSANIDIRSNGSIQTTNFKSGLGWKISSDGSATFYKATIRGNVTATSGKIGYWTIKDQSLITRDPKAQLRVGNIVLISQDVNGNNLSTLRFGQPQNNISVYINDNVAMFGQFASDGSANRLEIHSFRNRVLNKQVVFGNRMRGNFYLQGNTVIQDGFSLYGGNWHLRGDGQGYFEGLNIWDGKKHTSLADYIRTIINSYSFATKEWVEGKSYAKSSWFKTGSALTSARLDGTSIKPTTDTFVQPTDNYGK